MDKKIVNSSLKALLYCNDSIFKPINKADMNIDKDFTFQTIKLAPDYEGVIATLISSNRNLGNRKEHYTYMVIMTISYTHAEKIQ
jgi:hypothetical protein